MKKLLLLLTITSSLFTYAQKINETKHVVVTAEIVESIGDNYKVRSREMAINEDEKIIEYKGDVVFMTDMITLDADNVVYNHNTKEIVATGNFKAKGVTLEFKSNNKPTLLKYKLGDKVAYLE